MFLNADSTIKAEKLIASGTSGLSTLTDYNYLGSSVCGLGMTVDDHTLDQALDEGVHRKENARPFSHHQNRAPASPEPDLDVDYMQGGNLAARAPPLRSGR